MTTKTSACFQVMALIAALASHAVQADDHVAQLDAYMDACVEFKQFNGSVLVGMDDVSVFSKGYGMANFEHDIPNTPATKFRIGSITKQFTAMAVMVLEEQGKLNVQDPIVNYVADAPETWKDVTIHQLLTHTSGIPSYTEMLRYGRDMMLPQSTGQMVARFKNEPLNFPPGTEFRYSNSGYFLLGVIIEKASGTPYDEFIRKEICEPLYLQDTGYDRFQTVLKHRAAGYERRSERLVHAAYLDMSQPYAAGALYSTVEDLQRWDQALRRRELISEDRYQRMFTPEKNNYAYGWGVQSRSGRKTISHGGGINGFRSQILRFPAEKLCVVVLCNVQPASPERVANDLAAIMLGEEYEMPRTRKIVVVEPEILDAYQGQYQVRPELVLTIKRVGDQLTAQATGQPRIPLFPESEKAFFNEPVDVQVTFARDDQGRVSALWLNQSGTKLRAERIDAPEGK